MSDDGVVAKLTTIFRDQFDEPDLVLTRDMTAEDVEAWDSLAHVRLILDVEREFGIRFAAGEASELKDVGHLIDVVTSKVVS